MAERLASAPPPVPAEHMAPAWSPSAGMKFSTVRVQELRDAYVAVEHPEGWTAPQLAKALSARKPDVVARAAWWDADSVTTITEAVLGVNEPDDPAREPISLRPMDLTDSVTVSIVSEFSEDE